MPVTIKTAEIKYKDSNGQYTGINGIAETTTAVLLDALQDKGSVEIARIQSKADEVTSELANAAELENMFAGAFSPSTPYVKGQYVIQTITSGSSSVNKLFRFKDDHAAGAWTGTDVDEVKICNEVSDLKSAIFQYEYSEYTYCSPYSASYLEIGSGNPQLRAGNQYKLIIIATSAFSLDVLQIGTSGSSSAMVDTIASNVSFSAGENTFYYTPSQNGLAYLRILNNAGNVSSAIFYDEIRTTKVDVAELAETIADNAVEEDSLTDELKYKALNYYVTPQMFGAVGDGVEDDTQALQDAIDSGYHVVVPAGDYKIREPLIINKSGTIIEGSNRVNWEGNGESCNIVVDTSLSSVMDAVFLFTQNSNNITIENLYLKGGSKAKYGIYYNSTDEYFVYNIELRNLRIRECTVYGIYLNSLYLAEIDNVRVSRCSTGGFFLSGKTEGDYSAGGTTVTLNKCYADICPRGIRILRMNYSSLINCACDSISVACYQLENTNNISLINCGCEGTSGVPILLGTNRGITIQGFNVIQLKDRSSESIGDGIIECNNAQNIILSGFVVTGNAQAASRTYSILNHEPANTKIYILDNSILPGRCYDISNGCIMFYARDKIYTQLETPDFAGQMRIGENSAEIAVYNNNVLEWKSII